ncbi:TolC family outer membrane protein [Litorivivens sp.]|uniref:TolC family outer membrane protein n=1 Tax=Litorivivens sp. TaxID=2020868 RepID=UPI0035675801
MSHRFIPLALAGLVSFGSSLSLGESLSEIYELALQNDATLKAAEATYRANLETENITRAALLPQVSGNARYSRSESEIEQGPNPTRGTTTPINLDLDTDNTTLSLSLNQSIFDLPSWFTFRSGKLISKQAEAQLAADQQDLIVRVAQSYFGVLRAYENLEAARAEERAAKRQLEQTQQRFDVGLIAITDVHEARAVYDNTVAQRLTFEANLGTAYEALSVLTGRSHSEIARLSEEFPITDPTPADRAEWVNFALKNNHQLRAALYRMQSSQKTAEAKKWEHLPSVTGSINYQDSDAENEYAAAAGSFSTDDLTETVVYQIDLNVPIFSGGGVSATRRQAYEQYNAALQQKLNTQRQIVQQTRSLHLTVGTDVQRIKARKQNIVSAQSALDATKAGYEVGTRNIVDVLQSQRSLYAAIRDYANTRFDYVLNMLRLKQQAGTLSPDDIYMLDKWLLAEQAQKQDK